MKRVAVRFAVGCAMGYVLLVLMPPLVSDQPSLHFVPAGANAWKVLLGVLTIGVTSAASHWVRMRMWFERSDAEKKLIAERDWVRMTARGWKSRVAGYGGLLGLAIGLPIGGLMAFGFRLQDLPSGSRGLMVVVFTAFTLCWTVPAAFGIRWMVIRSQARVARARS